MVITDYIILGILTLATIRDLLAKFRLVPKSCKISRLVYEEHDSSTVRDILKDIGFSIEEVREHTSKIRISKDTSIPNKIIYLCINYLFHFPEEKVYGRKTTVNTHYYINTMEAVHNMEDREIMSKGITDLCSRCCKKMPDFIITPKTGNPFLSFEFGKQNRNIYTILIKDPNEGSFLKGGNEETLPVNYEGINRFKKNLNSRKKYYGIAVDCNGSGCNDLKNAIQLFNETVCGSYINVSPIKEAVILFRPDSIIDVDNDNAISIYRYFDLTEEIKEKMYQLQSKAGGWIAYNDTRYTKDIEDLKSLMNEKKLIKIKDI
jgi:hypothetical protein